MEIIELEPFTRRQLKCHHRYGRVVRGQDIGAVLRVAPLDTLPLNSDTTPPCVKRDTAAGIRKISAVVRLFVLDTRQVIQIIRLRDTRTVHSLTAPTVIANRTPDRKVMGDVHLDLRAIHTVHQQAVTVVTQVHA